MIECALRNSGVRFESVDSPLFEGGGVMFVNGQPRLLVQVEDAANSIIAARRCVCSLSMAFSVYLKTRCGTSEMHLVCDDGRLIRPLFVASAWRKLPSMKLFMGTMWTDLCAAGCVEFLGAEKELGRCVVAKRWSDFVASIHTHVEIRRCDLWCCRDETTFVSNLNQGP